jgi:hypothetical protein
MTNVMASARSGAELAISRMREELGLRSSDEIWRNIGQECDEQERERMEGIAWVCWEALAKTPSGLMPLSEQERTDIAFSAGYFTALCDFYVGLTASRTSAIG